MTLLFIFDNCGDRELIDVVSSVFTAKTRKYLEGIELDGLESYFMLISFISKGYEEHMEKMLKEFPDEYRDRKYTPFKYSYKTKGVTVTFHWRESEYTPFPEEENVICGILANFFLEGLDRIDASPRAKKVDIAEFREKMITFFKSHNWI